MVDAPHEWIKMHRIVVAFCEEILVSLFRKEISTNSSGYQSLHFAVILEATAKFLRSIPFFFCGLRMVPKPLAKKCSSFCENESLK